MVRARYLAYIGSLLGVDFPDRRVAIRAYDQRVSALLKLYVRVLGCLVGHVTAYELPIIPIPSFRIVNAWFCFSQSFICGTAGGTSNGAGQDH